MLPRTTAASVALLERIRRMPRRIVLFVFAGLVVTGAASAWAATQLAAAPSNSLSYTWSMPERFGADADKDGLVDYPTSEAYLNPSGFRVDADACVSPAIKDRGAATKVTWTITNLATHKTDTLAGTCKLAYTAKTQGKYDFAAALTATPAVKTVQQVEVKDTLIVSVGDSVASGEGNPDTLGPRQVGPFPYYTAKWEDRQCHRTALAGPAQAAVRLEKRDPHSSVTFLHLACSGATIDKGLLGPYAGIESEIDGTKLPEKPAQLDQAATMAHGRKIDTMLVSIGANNMGFANIVKACLALKDCNTTDQVPGGGDNAAKLYEKGMTKLPPLYKQLDAKLDEMGTKGQVSKVFMTEYFDVSQFDDGSICTGQTPQEREGNRNPDDSVIDGFSKSELAWTHDIVTPGINTAVTDAATAANKTGGPQWNVVEIDDNFAKHGYCAKDRWIRQIFESLAYQHDQNGAFHPNTEGHLYGYAKNIEAAVAPADGIGGTPLAFAPDERVKLSVDGISNVLGALDGLDAFETIASSVPYDARKFVNGLSQGLFTWLNKAQVAIKKLSDGTGRSLTQLENELDDIDGDGNPESDVHLPGLSVLEGDFDVDISPKLLTSKYEVRIKLQLKALGNHALKTVADGIHIGGQNLGDEVGLVFDKTLTIDPTAKIKVSMPADGTQLAKLGVTLNGKFEEKSEKKNPLSMNLGLLEASATGTVTADIGAAITLKRSSGSGVVDFGSVQTEAVFGVRCVSAGATMALDVNASVAGLGGKLGSISLDDNNLCDGLSAPEVQLAELGQFRNLTMADLINGLAQVTRAIQTTQATGDLKLPFITEPLSALTSVNEKLVKFFVDNGFTDPANPMATITVDTSESAKLKTLDAVVAGLEKALGLPAGGLGATYADGRVTFVLKVSGQAGTKTADVDFGDALRGNGIAGLTGKAKASITPSYKLNLRFGFDLAPGLPLDKRFFLANGAEGTALSLDAPANADVDLTATASVAAVRITDAAADGTVPLLRRKDDELPMVGVRFLDAAGSATSRIYLADLATSATAPKLPLDVTFGAKVPSTKLAVAANVLGQSAGSGSLSVAWPSVDKLTGSEALSVIADGTFKDMVLPFAYDPEHPRALITNVLNATREAITRIRGAVASGASTAQTPLPLIGKSVADLDPLLAKVQNSLDKLIAADKLATLPALQAAMNKALAEALDPGRLGGVTNLITFAYSAPKGSTPATVTVKLELGGCTADRDASGCSAVRPVVAAPFNLQLGTGSKVGGLAGLGTSGNLAVSYDARATLTMGVELPTVTAAADPFEAPRVTGQPRIFVQDTSAMTFGLGVKFAGSLHAGFGPVEVDLGTPAKKAKAGLAARFTLAAKKPAADPLQGRLYLGSSALNNFLDGLVPAAANGTGTTDVHDPANAACGDVAGNPDACASLPVFLNGVDLGSVTFTAPDLLTPSGWKFDTSAVEGKLGNQDVQFKLIANGVRTLAKQLEQTLRSLPAGTRLPLLGTDVTTAADVIGTFESKVLSKVDSLADALPKAPTVGAAEAKAAELLNSIPIVKAGGKLTVTTTCREVSPSECENAPLSKLQSFEVALPLSLQTTRSLTNFDIGFPGLRLQSGEKISGTAALDIDLKFGVDRDLGFYIPTGGNDPELTLRVSGRLPKTMSGELAFLPISIKDLTPDADDATVKAGVDLRSKRADGRLPLADLTAAELRPSLDASAAVHLDVRTVRPTEATSALPSIHSDVLVDASVYWAGDAGTTPRTVASVKFDKVSLDGGSLVTDFLKPAAREIRKVTGPLEKPIAEIKKPIPGLSDLAVRIGKKPISWYDAFREVDKILNPDKGGVSGLQMVDRVITFVDLVRRIDDDESATGEIPIGSFDLDTVAAAQPIALDKAGDLVRWASPTAGSVLDKLVLSDNGGNGQGDTAALADAGKTGGLSFPALEKPQLLFSMLLGQDVPLVYFDAGKLAIEKSFQLAYPIGPARLYIGGMAGLSGHFAVGFDTFGIRKAFELLGDGDSSNNGAWDIAKGVLQGVYLDDFDRTGKDVPEITLQAELTAGAAVGIPGFEAGAEGGIHGQIDFDLHTEPAQQGKIRWTDVAKQFEVNPNPVCFFDASAQVDAFIRLYVKTPAGQARYPIASGTVWKQDDLLAFCRTKVEQDKPTLLADLGKDGTLTLKTSDTAQHIFVTRGKADEVQVSADGIVETYKGVKKIFADLKRGDDEFDVEQPTQLPQLPVTVCGGAGNDRIGSETGPATLVGDGGEGCPSVASSDAGNDTIVGSGARDLLSGGPKSDSLDGGAEIDTLNGGDDADVLRGDAGNDVIDGGADDDTVDYGDHDAAVTVSFTGVNGTGGSAGETDTTSNVENVYGSAGGDTVTLPSTGSYRVDGGTGNDTVKTGGTTALVFSGDGADTIVGGTGDATVLGGANDDTFVDGPGSQAWFGQDGRDTVDYSAVSKRVEVTIDGQFDDGPEAAVRDDVHDADVVIGSAFDDRLIGSAAAEELRGGNGADLLDGGPGADTLLGGEGDDALDGGPDSDSLAGGAGDDNLVGGTGSDDMAGGADGDTADYSTRTTGVKVSKDDRADDGADRGGEGDNVHRDIERMLGGSGDDTFEGDAGVDTIVGNDGNDVLQGMRGADRIEGGNGDDHLYDKGLNDFNDIDETSDDTFVGGDGNDWAFGNGGNDTVDLGAGRDLAYTGPDNDVLHGGDGDDTVHGGAGDDTIDGDDGDDYLYGEADADVVRQNRSDSYHGMVVGGLGVDVVYNGTDNGGSAYGGEGVGFDDPDKGPNTIYGYGGDGNYYYGGDGPDRMILGAGNDIVSGNGGNDVIDSGDGRDTINAAEGDDTVTLGAGSANVSGGKHNDTIIGGPGRSFIAGDDGDDVLSGGGKDDILVGGPGDDTMTGGANSDLFEGGSGVDTVSYADRSAAVSFDGTTYHTAGDPVLDLHDGEGRDEEKTHLDEIDYDVEKVVGGAGNDTFTMPSDYHRTSIAFDGGAGDDTLTNGSPLPGTLTGGPGKDTLVGGSGPDVFVAGPKQDGADDMTGNAGIDAATYAARPAGSAVVSFDGAANDGTSGEYDNVRPDVESAPGAVLDGTAPRPTVSIAGTKVIEGRAGARTPAPVTVTLSSESGSDVTVPWSVASGTAIGGRDFVLASGTVKVPAGELSATVPVQVIGDALDEVDETAIVRLGAATEATTKVGTATVTIADDDAAPALTITGASVAEGKAGRTTKLTFTARLSAASGRAVSVRVATGNGTARAGSDFVARTATLSFAPGTTVKTFVVTVRGDKAREANEIFYATLSKPLNASLRVAKAAGTIRNDDK